MGPMSRDEKIMLGVMGAAVCLWVAGDALGVSAVVTAMMGLCTLLLTGVLKWRECLAYSAAWDTLFWFAGAWRFEGPQRASWSPCLPGRPAAQRSPACFNQPADRLTASSSSSNTPHPSHPSHPLPACRAVLVGMSGQLNSLGVINHFADGVGARLVAANLGWPAVFGLLNVAYFGLHYLFASQVSSDGVGGGGLVVVVVGVGGGSAASIICLGGGPGRAYWWPWLSTGAA